MTKGLKQKWIESAYSEFSAFGPDFSLKALAEKSKLPRASLYYHFDSKESLVEAVIFHHREMIEKYILELQKRVKTLIPDLYQVMFDHREGILFHRQLLLHQEKNGFHQIYKSANDRALSILLPQIKQLFGSVGTDEDFIQFYHTLTDAWYIRIDPNNFTVENLIAIALEIMENTLGLFSGIIQPKTN